MQINPTTSQLNFKWNRTAHLEMTALALKDCNLPDKVKRQVARYSQMPDFCKQELGFHCNTHFYFPDSKHKSFGLNTEKNNALQMFKDHLDAAIFCSKETDFLKHAGYAIHYIQDVAVPLHTRANSFIGKLLNYRLHREFERGETFGANLHLEEFQKEYQPQIVNFTTLLDLFKDTADFSQKPELQVNSSNKKDWKQIQQTCFNRSVDVTTQLFKMISYLREYFIQDS